MNNSQEHNGGFFIPPQYPNYAPINNAPISAPISNAPNAHVGFQPATNPFQNQNSISAKPQPPYRADTGSNPDLSHVIDVIVEAAQDAAKKAVKGEVEITKAAFEGKLEKFKLEVEAKVTAAVENMEETMRNDNSSLTENLNGTLSGLPAAINKEVMECL